MKNPTKKVSNMGRNTKQNIKKIQGFKHNAALYTSVTFEPQNHKRVWFLLDTRKRYKQHEFSLLQGRISSSILRLPLARIRRKLHRNQTSDYEKLQDQHAFSLYLSIPLPDYLEIQNQPIVILTIKNNLNQTFGQKCGLQFLHISRYWVRASPTPRTLWSLGQRNTWNYLIRWLYNSFDFWAKQTIRYVIF